MVRSMLYGGLEHMMWPTLYGHRPVNAEQLADRFSDALLHGIDGPAGHSGLEARLQRLEQLVAPAAPAKAARQPGRKTTKGKP